MREKKIEKNEQTFFRRIKNIIYCFQKKIIYIVLDIVSFDIAMKFAISNREKHKDFRRKLFEKEVEIYSLFGDDFEKNKKREIEEILEENPYKDI